MSLNHPACVVHEQVVESLLVERERVVDEVRAAQERLQEIDATVDKIRFDHRPSYPTPDQADGIVEAARRVKAKQRASTNQGDPAGTDSVIVDGDPGWFHVLHHAPFSLRVPGARLWIFSDDDLDAFVDLMEGEGLEVVSCRRTDEGASFMTLPAEANGA